MKLCSRNLRGLMIFTLILANFKFLLAGVDTIIATLRSREFVYPSDKSYEYYIIVSSLMLFEAAIWYWSCKKGINSGVWVSIVFIALAPCLIPLTMSLIVVSVAFVLLLNIILMFASISTHTKHRRTHT